MNVKDNNTTTKTSTFLLDMISSRAERIEELKNASEIDPLDVEYHVGSDNDIREIVLQLTAGGPTIDLYVYRGIIEGTMPGTRERVHVQNDPLMRGLRQRYEPLL
jgi:hypothetical protein